ncbi:vitamin K epoxide reductase family protein [bacterium]|jgi:uncharacterized membrane protein|nr:vitamin K epoxide reductase family protein [bacterium]NBX49674.1 vitamin K epoxide reductase family protein [bacterium]
MSLPKWAPLIPIVAFIGLADALYLTLNHYFGVPLACGPLSGCDTVTSSVYSIVLGIPVALFGVLYYLAMFFGMLFALEYQSAIYFRLFCLFSLAGLIASGWFVFVMAVLLQAWCTYCLVSAFTSTLLFLLSMFALSTLKRTPPPSVSSEEPKGSQV